MRHPHNRRPLDFLVGSGSLCLNDEKRSRREEEEKSSLEREFHDQEMLRWRRLDVKPEGVGKTKWGQPPSAVLARLLANCCGIGSRFDLEWQ
jgi:hypothetical protein